MKKYFFSILFILFAFTISLVFPYGMIFLKNIFESWLSIDPELLKTVDYIPMLTAFFSFMTTIAISYLIYNLNRNKAIAEKREAAFEFAQFLLYSLTNIQNYVQLLASLELEIKPRDYVVKVYQFGLSKKDICVLNETISCIQGIATESDQKTKEKKCQDLTNNESQIKKSKAIIKKLSKKYRIQF